MTRTAGWHRISTGWYEYTNAASKTLAYVQRNHGQWDVTVLPMADDDQHVTLSECPKTYREAKGLAERAYLSLTKSALARQAEALKKHGH